jgi:DNA (cytosine-5)-methyltransferase 1
MALTFGSLFAGGGGFDKGLENAGWQCEWQVEINDDCNRVLAKHWPGLRRHGDVRTFPPGNPDDWRVEWIVGGFPCQDISVAGKRVGIEGERSGLWGEYVRIIRTLRPSGVIVENVAALLSNGMGRVLGDLAELGFDAEWDVLPTCAFGAPHSRERVFLIAHSDQERCRRWRDRMSDAPRHDHWKATQAQREWKDVERWLRETFSDCDREETDAATAGMVDGIPAWMDREAECGIFGNSVSPIVAEWLGRRIVEACS